MHPRRPALLMDRVNLGRRLLEEGRHKCAISLLEEALGDLECATHTLDASEIEYALDIVTLVALGRRELGDASGALLLLTEGIAARLPRASDLSQVLHCIGDPERRQTLVMGQFGAWEMSAEHLAPTEVLRGMLARLTSWVRACEVPMLHIQLGYARASLRRLGGDLLGAARDFLDVALAAAAALRCREHAAGHTPAWSFCNALVSLEAAGRPPAELVEHLRRFERGEELRLGHGPWEHAYITGLRHRLGLGTATDAEPLPTDDLLLRRLQADARLSSISGPSLTAEDCQRFVTDLVDAPPACRLSYLWRAARRTPVATLRDALDTAISELPLQERRRLCLDRASPWLDDALARITTL